MDLNRTIGNNGKLPWPKIKEDFAFFKKMTIGDNLIMGRKTFDSVGELPGRFTWILTNDQSKMAKKCLNMAGESYAYNNNSAYVERADIDKFIATEGKDPRYTSDLWVCGGAQIYKDLIPLCTDVYVTLVLNEYEGDTFLPEFEHLFIEQTIIKEHKDFWIIRYHTPTAIPGTQLV